MKSRAKEDGNVVPLRKQKAIKASRKEDLRLRSYQYAGGKIKNDDGMPEAERFAGHWRDGYDAAVSDMRKLLIEKQKIGKRPYRNAVREFIKPKR